MNDELPGARRRLGLGVLEHVHPHHGQLPRVLLRLVEQALVLDAPALVLRLHGAEHPAPRREALELPEHGLLHPVRQLLDHVGALDRVLVPRDAELALEDLTRAADLFRPIYERTHGVDGYVSLEVSPLLAYDTARTLAEARRLHALAGRPNLLIKIPGTVEGVAAVEALLFEGINVNITLLFAVDRYEEVARAYMSALERRKAAHAPLAGVASVASFFLSRIDTAVDEQLQQKMKSGLPQAERLLGRCGTANARLAYRRFRDLVSSERWRALEAAGARPQRLLWASTSTKNPSYDDLMYVEPLIGPHTINTLPRKTSAAFAERGKAAATLEQGLAEADGVVRDLAAAGIDLSRVTRRLLFEYHPRS